MKDYKSYIKRQIKNKNSWYIDSQLDFGEKESIKRIYEKRLLFFNKLIEREINKKGKINLLDYGCGDGYWSKIFSKFSQCEIIGVDYNFLRLKRAKSLLPNVKFMELDLNHPNKRLGKFDIIFCSQIIEHIDDDIYFLKNIKNHLKRDGILILGTPNEGSFTQKHFFRKHILKGSDHVHLYKEKEIKEKIENTGFIIKNIYREVFFPGYDQLYYRLTSTDIGFKLLELLTILFPSQCSDYYFELVKK